MHGAAQDSSLPAVKRVMRALVLVGQGLQETRGSGEQEHGSASGAEGGTWMGLGR